MKDNLAQLTFRFLSIRKELRQIKGIFPRILALEKRLLRQYNPWMQSIIEIETKVDELVERWIPQRADRLRRRALDPGDFEDLASAGYLTLAVPVDHGGSFSGLSSIAAMTRILAKVATVDPSLALVASMHPTVAIWWALPTDPPSEIASTWSAEIDEVFAAVMSGTWLGTITSEPGTGGDFMKTTTSATHVEGEMYALSGIKHFGSGSGVLDRLITTAVRDGHSVEPFPDIFVIEAADWPSGAVDGMSLIAPWDGVGMKATQSHGASLEGVVARRYSWSGGWAAHIDSIIAASAAVWISIIAAVVDTAMAEAGSRLRGRGDLGTFEAAGWAEAEIDRFLLGAARDSVVNLCEADDPPAAAQAARRAKLGTANLAESCLTTISRVIGGGSLSASSPFASWFEDVRALGFLRPPWGLATDALIEELRTTA